MRRDVVDRGLDDRVGVGKGVADPTTPGSDTSATVPERPGATAFSSSSASSLRWCSCRTLPVAAPAAPRAAALPMMDGGKIAPRAMPPTQTHLSPERVL